jgi:hypothetical protein
VGKTKGKAAKGGSSSGGGAAAAAAAAKAPKGKKPRVVAAAKAKGPRTFPQEVLENIAQFVRDPRTLCSIALAFRGGVAAVKSIPPWNCLLLEDGEVLEGRQLPVHRAIDVILRRKCELCGKGSVKSVKTRDFGLFAHDACVDHQLINEFYLNGDEKARVRAAHAPSIQKSGMTRGYHGWRDWVSATLRCARSCAAVC